MERVGGRRRSKKGTPIDGVTGEFGLGLHGRGGG